jgi:uncharacterized cupredoxin-like copper-binding protein
MTGSRAIALTAVPAALLAVGCGSNPTYTREPDRRVVVTLDEFRVRPEHIQVKAGRMTIVARDRGRLTHNLEVVAFRRPKSGEQERQFGEATKTLFPGQTDSTTVDLRPGKYRLICTISNHDNLGMWAELKVV